MFTRLKIPMTKYDKQDSLVIAYMHERGWYTTGNIPFLDGVSETWGFQVWILHIKIKRFIEELVGLGLKK